MVYIVGVERRINQPAKGCKDSAGNMAAQAPFTVGEKAVHQQEKDEKQEETNQQAEIYNTGYGGIIQYR